MAKVKLTFTEDQIKLIRNFRINELDQRFYITTSDPKQEVAKVNNKKYNITKETDFGTKFVSQINIITDSDFENPMIGIDATNIWGGTFIFEDIAIQLGLMDKIIPGTEESPLGPQFEEETQQYLMDLASFIVDNLKNIESILHQFCTEGIKAGVTYVRNNNSDIWSIQE